MEKIICLKHPHYKGEGPPELSCKTCCQIFIEFVKLKKYDSNNDFYDKAKKAVKDNDNKEKKRECFIDSKLDPSLI